MDTMNDTATLEQGQEGGAPTHEQPDPERLAIEAEARRQGWRPKEEYTGHGTWVDAPEFLERGKQFQSILKRENRELKDEIADLKKRQQEAAEVFKEFRTYSEQTRQREYERARRDIIAEREAAVAAGNVEGFNKAQAEIEALDKDHRQPVTPAPDQRADPAPRATAEPPKPHPYVEQWVRENPWFNEDPIANAFAQTVSATIRRQNPDISVQEELAQTRREVAKRFPEHFGNPRREAPGVVSAPHNGATRQIKKGKSYDDLPSDAKAACDRFVKQGLMKQEDYVKDYFLGEEK